MNNNKQIKIMLIYLAIFVILFTGWYLWQNQKAEKNDEVVTAPSIEILGNKSDLVSFSIDPGAEVSGVLTVAGSVRGGYFFEANIVLNILDSDKKVIRASYGNAKTDWMTAEPVGFDGVLDFTKLPKGPAYIEIHNDNASGPPENDKSILIPVIIK